MFVKKMTWQRTAILLDGSLVIIRPIRLDDDVEVQAVADLVARNFREHSHYTDLSKEARSKYIQSNDVSGIKQTCSYLDNIMTVVVEGEEGILGYSVVRKLKDLVAEGRRLHVHIDHNGKGIGSLLNEEALAIARYNGCEQLCRNASGQSFRFFRKRGYVMDSRRANEKMRACGIEAHVDYCYAPTGLKHR